MHSSHQTEWQNKKKLYRPTIQTSYPAEDVTFLLKDVGYTVKEQQTAEREKAIQNGVHYSEMLPIEYEPSHEYIALYENALKKDGHKVALLIGILAEKLYSIKGNDLVIVSLARAGTPVGVLLLRYLRFKYNITIPHYSISIIRGKGIDENALLYILHSHRAENLVFVDGWTGKGAILKVLQSAILHFNCTHKTNISPHLAVLADPGHCAQILSTHEDFLIPSACLNSTISGLVSRTFHRADIINENDFHGARFYSNLVAQDRSMEYIKAIASYFSSIAACVDTHMQTNKELINENTTWEGMKSVKRIATLHRINDINLIKPGIGETTRVLLRRVPWKILVHPDKYHLLGHIVHLAKEKKVEIIEFANMSYSCCGLIKEMKK